MKLTVHECRLCFTSLRAGASALHVLAAGWYLLRGVDGPAACCPVCKVEVDTDPTNLDDLREDYPQICIVDHV